MINVNYNTDNGEKNVIIKIVDKDTITGIEAIEFATIIDGIDKDTNSATIDIDNVKFIASPGIGMILNAHIILKRNNIKLKIINASESIRKLFVMTKVDYVIPVEYKEG
jgi:anti-anti-sigma factor